MKIGNQILIIMFLMSHLSCSGQNREERDLKATNMLGPFYKNVKYQNKPVSLKFSGK